MPWRTLDALAVLATHLVLQVVVGAVAFALGAQPDDPIARTILITATPLMLVVLTLVWVRARGSGGPRRLFGARPPAGGDVIAGVIGGVTGAVVITFLIGVALRLILRRFGIEMPPVQEALREFATGPTAPLAIFVIAVVAPLAEELFFRGMLFQALYQRMKFWPAAITSGVIFGAVHAEPFVIVLTTIVGVLMAWLFRLRGTLAVPIVAHMVFNAIGVVLIRAGLG